uniref:Uncharacterized protein n=1 Tax=Rhodosorus marinus TaxID=101924 RepID=A0A7S3EGF3_9RHOD|mmetsp:Transcript_33981/g.133262  ORF Transcript_33981/g.133262 Transcript_33981/m.133262 type:complete len:228 (+) Transcript_33981:340-1023(+)
MPKWYLRQRNRESSRLDGEDCIDHGQGVYEKEAFARSPAIPPSLAVPVCQLLALQSGWQPTAAVNCSYRTLERFRDFLLARSWARCQQARFPPSLEDGLRKTIAQSGMRFSHATGLHSTWVSDSLSEPFPQLLFVPQHVMRHERISLGQRQSRKRKLVEVGNYIQRACSGRVVQRRVKSMKVANSGQQLSTGVFFKMSIEQDSPGDSILGSSHRFPAISVSKVKLLI